MEATDVDTRPVDRYKSAFDAAPIPMWQLDLTRVQAFCRELQAGGVDDVRSHLYQDDEALERAVAGIEVLGRNRRAAAFDAARSGPTGATPAALQIEPATRDALVEHIGAIADGARMASSEVYGLPLTRGTLDCVIHWETMGDGAVVDYSSVVVMVKDITREVEAERRLRFQAAQLQALNHVGQEITSSFDMHEVLQNIVDSSVDVVGAWQSIILLFDEETETLTEAVSNGAADSPVEPYTYAEVMDGISGWVARTGEGTRSANTLNDPRNTGLAAERAAAVGPLTAAIAPVTVDGRTLGTLTVLNELAAGPFTEHQLYIVEMLAAHAAVAIRNGRLYDEITSNHQSLQSTHEELKLTQSKLLQAQKMEAIGSLAAGIAHEINTPVQYIGDNTRFVAESIESFIAVHAAGNDLARAAADKPELTALVAAYDDACDAADIEFLAEELPIAVDQTLEGIDRVAGIVRAMKEFSHPGSESKSALDLNRAVETTIAVASNEWKYVATIDLQLEPSLPMVPALSGPLNQCLLILLVNAAQAIGEQVEGTENKGKITIATNVVDDHVVVSITDNGPGIPEEVQGRIFDPFFTTKDVGKGSGQGLAIAHSVVVEQHEGELEFETAQGEGTTFHVRLPLSGEDEA